jgi:protein TonB
MLRLRTTTSLSLLALAVGVAGTQWLSGFNTGWAGPSERVAGFASVSRRHAVPSRQERPSHGMAPTHRVVLPAMAFVAQAEPAPPPELVPVSMPQLSTSWSQMEGHLQGRVLLHLTVDGSGRVASATLSESSGDPVLDAHALATVRRWRFAVPDGHPDGFSGDLPMRFSSAGQRLAEAP